jgi:peptidylprolyl isomerase
VSSRAKAAAAEAARRRQARRRVGAAIGGGVLVIAILGGAVIAGGSGTSSTTTTVDPNASLVDPSTTSTTLASAAGMPCVPLADPLPAGAPAVPVKTGPPPTELVKEDLKTGDGAEIVATNTLSVQYIGVSCSTGKIFDSSWSRGQPASFALSEVIVGWQQGLVGMKVGGQRLLGIPPALAYGTQGRPGIAPDETLWFVVDVVSAT